MLSFHTLDKMSWSHNRLSVKKLTSIFTILGFGKDTQKNAKTPFRLAIASPVFPVQLRVIVGKEKAPELHLAMLLSGLLNVAWNTDNKRIVKQHWWKSVLSTSKTLLNIAALGCFIWTAKFNHCSCLDVIITDQRSKPQGRTHRANVALSREEILISVTI